MGLLAAVWKLYGGALTTAVLAGLLAGIVVAFVKKELRRTGGTAAAPTRIVRIRKAEIVRGVRRPRRRQKPHGAEQKRNIARALKRSAVWVVMSLGGLVVGVAGALLGAASDVLQVGLASIRWESRPPHIPTRLTLTRVPRSRRSLRRGVAVAAVAATKIFLQERRAGRVGQHNGAVVRMLSALQSQKVAKRRRKIPTRRLQ